jgi:hypothetical protein
MNDTFHLPQPSAGGRAGSLDPPEFTGLDEDLPPPDTKRWVVRRKAVVVNAVRNGSITLQEACRRYRLSVEEFVAWQRAIERYGIPGLRVTRLQIYRDTDEARAAK